MISVNKIDDVIRFSQIREVTYNENLKYFGETLDWNTKPLEIDPILEKLPLAAYLISGKKILKL